MSLLFRDAAGPSLAPGGSVLCVGAFDGVHVGHRALLARVHEQARARGLRALAISFEPIPREFFARGEPVPRLTCAREKIRLLLEAGIEHVLSLRFDAALAAMPAERFIEDVLISRADARGILVGSDFRFGHARRGDVAMLRRYADRGHFTLELMPEIDLGDGRVSSSAIRERLAQGDFDAAARMLGRRFSIGGRVVRGRRLGRALGYPTANIRLGARTSPISGIFAVRVRGIAGAGSGSHAAEHADAWPGVASLGVRPTIDGGGEPLLEVHLFDFDGDLYGRRLEVEFVGKLREELKFDDLDAMVRQIDRDADGAREILGTIRAAGRRAG